MSNHTNDFEECPDCGHILGTYMACRRCIFHTDTD